MSFSVISQFTETGNQSLSVLTFTPTRDDDGLSLGCQSENPFIPESSIEDKWRLVVHCKCSDGEKLQSRVNSFSLPDPPAVTLRMGSNLNAKNIKEGDDAYFECHVQANPKAKITWFQNVSPTGL